MAVDDKVILLQHLIDGKVVSEMMDPMPLVEVVGE